MTAERDRRTAQFAVCLRRMAERSRATGDDGCFIVFNESPELHRPGKPLEAIRQVSIPVAAGMTVASGASWAGPWTSDRPAPREHRPPPRFVQFAFDGKLFYMDLPKTTLERPEAERLLRDRSGFFYMASQPRFPYYSKVYVGRFDPVCKVYLFDDQETAAEDMTYVFFDLWRFPVDWQFYMTAGAFDGTARFETDSPLE